MKSKHKVPVYATHERLHAIPGYTEDYEDELVVDRLNKNGHMVASNVVLVNDVRVTRK